MALLYRPARAGAIAIMGIGMMAITGVFSSPAAIAAAPSAGPRFAAINGTFSPTTDAVTGSYHSARMSIEVNLTPRNPAALSAALRAVYTRSSGQYGHWLGQGQFDARFGPAPATRSAVASYLSNSGLTVGSSSSPFLVRASGSSQQVSAAFRTTLENYKDPRGIRYFANSSAVRLPGSLAGEVLGVIGLSSTVREHSSLARAGTVTRPAGTGAADHRPAGTGAGPATSCEDGYPSRSTLFSFFNDGTGFNAGYGAGPGCSGLTPSQDNSIYGAPSVGPRGKGQGVDLAVYELSAYQPSDIDTWVHTFYGMGYTPPLADVNVDGGPLSPACPAGDICPPDFEGFSGDVEVDADIETELAIAPDVRHLLVYNAPNDETGQTELDEYVRIANDDSAQSISSSWGLCENDAGASYAQAENTVFEQMALQGQSMFSSAGDTGAFDCIRSDGTTIVNVDDPPSQPWVTSVGGTSLEHDNPGTYPAPAYPAGVETVWNVDNLCNTSADEGGFPGLFWCGTGSGAGGGGSSQFWGRPVYQHGPGISNPFTTHGNGTTQCALAAVGTPCREVPDISANADEYTPYSEYCTGSVSTPNSDCATFSGSLTPPGWFGIGGTSLSSPLWAAIIADRDSFQGHRSGNINPLLYFLYTIDRGRFFHDITGVGPAQANATNNGLFPTRPGYDLATGIGTPKMAALITKNF
jgi:subtilase family serine protease